MKLTFLFVFIWEIEIGVKIPTPYYRPTSSIAIRPKRTQRGLHYWVRGQTGRFDDGDNTVLVVVLLPHNAVLIKALLAKMQFKKNV